MAYTKQTWETGDIVTAAKLNNIENGISNLSDLFFAINAIYDEQTETYSYIAEKPMNEYESFPSFALLNDGGDLSIFENIGNGYYVSFRCAPYSSPNIDVRRLVHDPSDNTGLIFILEAWTGNIELTENN